MPEEKIKPITAAVVSKSGNKSVKVAINYKVKHPKYGKYMKRRTLEHNYIPPTGNTVIKFL